MVVVLAGRLEIELRAVIGAVAVDEVGDRPALPRIAEQVDEDAVDDGDQPRLVLRQLRHRRRDLDIGDHTPSEGVERHDVGASEVVREALADLVGGLAVERENEDLARRNAQVAHQVRDLAGDHGGLARARPSEHQRRVLVGGDRPCLLVGRRRREHAGCGLCHRRDGAGNEPGVGLLPRRLECLEAGDRREARDRLARACRQVVPQQRSATAPGGRGNVRLEAVAHRVAPVAVGRLEALEAVVELRELGRDLPGSTGGILAHRLGEPIGFLPIESADGPLGACGFADRKPRPEPRAARLDSVDRTDGRAGSVTEAHHPAVEGDAGGAAAQQADEQVAGRGDRAGVWGHRGPNSQGA